MWPSHPPGHAPYWLPLVLAPPRTRVSAIGFAGLCPPFPPLIPSRWAGCGFRFWLPLPLWVAFGGCEEFRVNKAPPPVTKAVDMGFQPADVIQVMAEGERRPGPMWHVHVKKGALFHLNFEKCSGFQQKSRRKARGGAEKPQMPKRSGCGECEQCSPGEMYA